MLKNCKYTEDISGSRRHQPPPQPGIIVFNFLIVPASLFYFAPSHPLLSSHVCYANSGM